MTIPTGHTIAGFVLDSVFIATGMMIPLADVNAVLGTGAALVALVTAIVRLFMLIRPSKVKPEDEETND